MATIKAVIYGKVKNTAAKAVVEFDKSACEKADVNVDEQVVEKLMIPPVPLTKGAFDRGWNSTPEIQFESGRYINAPTRYVEFIHTSMMNEPVEEEYILLNGMWQTVDSNSAFAATKFKENEIQSPVYWS